LSLFMPHDGSQPSNPLCKPIPLPLSRKAPLPPTRHPPRPPPPPSGIWPSFGTSIWAVPLPPPTPGVRRAATVQGAGEGAGQGAMVVWAAAHGKGKLCWSDGCRAWTERHPRRFYSGDPRVCIPSTTFCRCLSVGYHVRAGWDGGRGCEGAAGLGFGAKRKGLRAGPITR
jgi:hypothetical protein